MTHKNLKALDAWIDENILDTMQYQNGRMASLKGAYNLSAYLFLIYACNSRAKRANNGYDYIMNLGNKNESLQDIYFNIACGLSDMANFDFIINQKDAHEIVKKLLNQTDDQANKYSYDEACKYLINKMYMRTVKKVDIFKIADWVVNDHFTTSEARINLIKTIK